MFDPFEIEVLACPLLMHGHLGPLVVGDEVWKQMEQDPGDRVRKACNQHWVLVNEFPLALVNSKGDIGLLNELSRLMFKPTYLLTLEERAQLDQEMGENPILELFRNGRVWNQGEAISL